MMKKNGIVLRTLFPAKQKVILLDADLGKVEASVPDIKTIVRITNGALMEYRVTQSQHGLSLHEVDYLDVPFPLARVDVIFLHHVLELARFFIPLESVAKDLYQLLLMLYHDERLMTDSMAQKLFLVRFFMMLGLYPETITKNPSLYALISLPIEVMLEKKVDEQSGKLLAAFLSECMSSYPHLKDLKTISFIG